MASANYRWLATVTMVAAFLAASTKAVSVVQLASNVDATVLQSGTGYQHQPYLSPVLSPNYSPSAIYSSQFDSQRFQSTGSDGVTGRLLDNLDDFIAATSPAVTARADLVWNPDGSSAGWVVLYQPSAASNMQVYVKLQSPAMATQPSNPAIWRVEVRPNPIASSGTRCAASTIGSGPFNPLNERGAGILAPSDLTSSLSVTSTTTSGLSTYYFSSSRSVAPSIATMFGSNTIVGRSVRIASDLGDAGPIFCGNIVQQ